jgi:hypothetical protein
LTPGETLNELIAPNMQIAVKRRIDHSARQTLGLPANDDVNGVTSS